jgi:hypothetical protein
MDMVGSPQSLVVIDQLNFKSVRSFKTEYDTPIGPHRHRPKTFQVALEPVEAVRGKAKSVGRSRCVENRQNFLDGIGQIRPNPAPIAAFMEPLQPPMLETPNHQAIP